MKKSLYLLFALHLGFLFACSEEAPKVENTPSPSTQSTAASAIQSSDSVVTMAVERYVAEIDEVAMKQVGLFDESASIKTIIQYYHSSHDVERWSDKMWGRCCTEADMSFVEWLSFDVSVDKQGSAYPFKNALDANYNSTFVFEKEDSITIAIKFYNDSEFWEANYQKSLDKFIAKEDTIMRNFQVSIINGFSKSEKAYYNNARIKEVELWLNGAHMCNIELLDKPDIQMLTGNFPFFKNDLVEIKPIAYFPGKFYDDICISEIQRSLSYSCHEKLNRINLYEQ